jgi:hypothetical protein
MFRIIFLALFLGLSWGAQAQSLQLGAHVGALGVDSKSEIAYGINLTSNPYGFAGFRMDATFAEFSGARYFSTSPAVIFYPVDFAEMQLGVLGGAGFYKLPQDKTRFGTNFGVLGDFMLSKTLSVGMETRYHYVFDADSVWTVFLTAAYKFELSGGW